MDSQTLTREAHPVHLPGVPDETVIGVIPAGELAELGIAVDVPILAVKWHDERTGCATAHRYLAGELDGAPGDYTGCHFYHGARCDMNGRGANPCLFHEPESGPSWGNVKRWRLLEYPDGSQAITTAHSAAELAALDGARVIGWQVTP